MKVDWLHWKKFEPNISNGDTVLNPDFKEFIELLNKNNVRYLLVGGYALAMHGYPRYTKDIDIWVKMENNNAELLLKTIKEFGFESIGLKAEDFLTSGYVVQLGQPPNRIVLLTSVSGLEFDSCYPQRLQIDIDGISIDCIDLESFKVNKKASGRYQDLADLENLDD